MNIHLLTLKKFCEKKYELHKSTLKDNGRLKHWKDFKGEFSLHNNFCINNGCYLHKLHQEMVMHSQVKLGYWPRSNLLKSSINTKQPSAKS